MDELARHGPHLFPRSEPTSLHKTSDGIMMTLADGSTHGPFDQAESPPQVQAGYCNTLQVLWAVGRTPATANLNLPAAAVMCVASGHIPVDEFENTNVPGV
jgi:glutathione reductase (NADPH)